MLDDRRLTDGSRRGEGDKGHAEDRGRHGSHEHQPRCYFIWQTIHHSVETETLLWICEELILLMRLSLRPIYKPSRQHCLLCTSTTCLTIGRRNTWTERAFATLDLASQVGEDETWTVKINGTDRKLTMWRLLFLLNACTQARSLDCAGYFWIVFFMLSFFYHWHHLFAPIIRGLN